MDKIAFLVADELMQQSVATIIQTYNEKLPQHSFRIKIEIIDFPRLIDTIPHPLPVQFDERCLIYAPFHCAEI